MKKIILFIMIILSSNILFADSIQFVDNTNGSKINWTKGLYIAVGEAIIIGDTVRAKEEAKNQALINLLSLIENTVINTNNRGNNYLEDFHIKHKIRVLLSIISPNEIKKVKDINGEKYVVKIVCPIYGAYNIGGIFLNKCIRNERSLIYNKDEMIFPVIAKEEKFPVEIKDVKENFNNINNIDYVSINKSSENYTGVIFNVIGFKFNNSLCPKVRIENGDVVWTMSKEDVNIVINKGIVYSDTLENGKNNSLVGNNPLIISAVNVCGIYNSDIIIKEEDAKILKSENNISHFLNKLKIIIVSN